jgi:hypothetical protein
MLRDPRTRALARCGAVALILMGLMVWAVIGSVVWTLIEHTPAELGIGPEKAATLKINLMLMLGFGAAVFHDAHRVIKMLREPTHSPDVAHRDF